MIKVIDNFVPARYQDELELVFGSDNFLWSYQSCTYKPYAGTDERIQDVPFLGRKLFGGNTYTSEFDLVRPMIYFFMEHTGLDVKEISRVKANMMFVNSSNKWHPPHTDSDFVDHYTLLYYVNSSDSNTLIFKDKSLTIDQQIQSVKGRAVVFPSNQLHCGTNPTTNMKVALNFVISARQRS